GHRATGAGRFEFRKNSPRARIFLPLDHAMATGWSLPGHPLRARNYPLLGSPNEAISYFADLAERLDAELWVKAHPSEQKRATFVEQAKRDPRVTFIEGGIEEALFTADVVVTFLTKVAYTALALDKAVVTLSPNPAAVSGLTYHCRTMDDIETQMRRALAEGARPDQRTLTARFLGYLDRRYFVANDLRGPGALRLLDRWFPAMSGTKVADDPSIDQRLTAADPLAPDA